MSRKIQYVCDACGKLLYGRDGMDEVSETYIQIVGNITLQVKPAYEGGERGYTYISPSKFSELNFCDHNCFNEYIKSQSSRRETFRIGEGY